MIRLVTLLFAWPMLLANAPGGALPTSTVILLGIVMVAVILLRGMLTRRMIRRRRSASRRSAAVEGSDSGSTMDGKARRDVDDATDLDGGSGDGGGD